MSCFSSLLNFCENSDVETLKSSTIVKLRMVIIFVSKDKKLLTEQDKNIEGCKNCSSGNLADKTIIENKIKTITQIIGIVS